MAKLKSRKLWLALAGMAWAVLQVLVGALTPVEGIEAVKVIAVAYLVAEGTGDAVARARG